MRLHLYKILGTANYSDRKEIIVLRCKGDLERSKREGLQGTGGNFWRLWMGSFSYCSDGFMVIHMCQNVSHYTF